MDMGSVDKEGNKVETKRTFLKRDLLRKGDLIMPKDDIGGGQIIGRTALINKDNAYVLGDHAFRISPICVDSPFIHYQINSINFNNKIKLNVTGSAQLGIRGFYVENSVINVPLNKSEQVKIGKIFLHLDSLITLHQRKPLLEEIYDK